MMMRPSFPSVSYTHLDVYKRQVQNILVLRHSYNPAEMHHILPLRKIADPELALSLIHI